MNLGLESGKEAGEMIAALRPLAAAQGLWRPTVCAKGAILFAADQRPTDVFVLTSGLVKLTYLTDGGAEWIKSLLVNVAVFAAAEDGDETGYAATCLEPCEVVRLPRSFVAGCIETDAEVRRSWIAQSTWIVRRKQAREQALLCLSAEERFLAMRDQGGDLMQRLSQGDIARYLGITPVAFSRIKRRLSAR